MKNFKKMVIITLVLALALAAFGCGASDSKYVGKWQLTQVTTGGVKANPKDMGMELNLEVKDNGDVVLSEAGSDAEKGEWEEIDGGIKIKDSKVDIELKEDKDGKLKGTYEGVEMTFEKAK